MKNNQFFEQENQQFLQEITNINNKIKSKKKKICQQSLITQEVCEQIAKSAEVHSRATLLNTTSPLTFEQLRTDLQIEHCGCGCQKSAGQQFSMNTYEENLSFLGPGVILYFFFMRSLHKIIFITIAIYACFSLASNIFSMEQLDFEFCKDTETTFDEILCKINYCTSYNLKGHLFLKNFKQYLGLLSSIIWIVGFGYIQFLGYKKNQEINLSLDSTSDYTIFIQNLPQGQYHEQELYQFLLKIWQTRDSANLINQEQTQSSPLKLKNIQIVYNLKQFQDILEEIKKISTQIVSIVINENKICCANHEQYLQKKQKFLIDYESIQLYKQKFINEPEFRASLSTSFALVQFQNSDQQMQFLSYFTQNFSSFSCSNCGELRFKQQHIATGRAPEPSDMRLQNCGKKFSYLRFVIIWLITILILYAAFSLVTFIQTLEFMNSKTAILASIVLQIFNRVIWISMSFLVALECHNTKTDQIKSLMGKSLLAQILNVVIVPMINCVLFKKRLYGSESVSFNSTLYQFIIFFMMFIFYVANPIYFAKLLALKIKFIRNKIIRALCRITDTINTIEEIKPVFTFYEFPEFLIAGAYVYMSTAMIHAFFYCYLQPILLFLFMFNMIGFFFIMKYLLFKRCKMSELTSFQIYKTAISFIKLGPIFYFMGTITFIILGHQEYDQEASFIQLFPAILGLILSFIFYFNLVNLQTRVNKLIFRVHRKIKRINTVSFNTNENPDSLTQSKFIEALDQLKIKYRRKQSYLKSSNLQILFNYQNYLKDMSDLSSILKEHQLQQFCESFIKKSHKTKCFIRQNRKKKIQLAINDLNFIPVQKNKKKQKISAYKRTRFDEDSGAQNIFIRHQII